MSARTARNCNLEDVADVVGYRNTRILAGWFAGRNLKVPLTARLDHPLNVLIGSACFRMLVDEFGGSELWVRTKTDDLMIHRDRAAADAFAHGMSAEQVAEMLDMRPRRARMLKAAMTANGMIDYARMAPDETARPEFSQELAAILETANPIDLSGDVAVARMVEALVGPAPIAEISSSDAPRSGPTGARGAP